ncbi:MAG: peptidase M23, partial [Bacteroidales bacterium]|nr:peptidase M23 [Bacteroidales bacterium]MDY2705675.1 peptidase M23 [Alloprevotella sp.]
MNLSLHPSALRRWSGRIALLLVILLLCPYVPAQNSKKVKQMQAQRNALQKKINEGEQLLKANRRDVRSQMNNLAILDAQINDHQSLMNGIQTEADSLQGNITQLSSDIAVLQSQLERCKANYRRALTYVSQNLAKQSRWSFVLMAKDFRTMYRRLRYMVEFSKNQKAHGAIIAQKERQLRQKQQDLHQAKSVKDSLLVEGRATRAALDSKKQERQAVVDNLNQQQQQLQQNIAKQRKEYT